MPWVITGYDDDGEPLTEWVDDPETVSPVTEVVVPPPVIEPNINPEYVAPPAPATTNPTGGNSQDHDLTSNEALTGQGWKQDEVGNWYKLDSSGNLTFKDDKGTDFTYDTKKGGFVDSKGNFAGGDSGLMGLVKQGGQKLLDLFKGTDGKTDWTRLLSLAGGFAAANKPNNAAPTGYQGKIPKLTATSNMLTAPPVNRRPGSGGINYGGGTTYRNEKGEVVSSNEKTLAELRAAADSNPFNRPSTYESRSGLGATSLDELLAAMKPSDAAVAANAAASKTPTTSAADLAGLLALLKQNQAAPGTTTTTPVGNVGTKPSTGSSATASRTTTSPTATSPTTSPANAPLSREETLKLRTAARDEYAAGPKTQDQLDKLLLKYPPAVMQAEFPEFGGVGNYNTATMEAYYRQEQKARQQNREAMRGSNQGTVIANPGGDVQISTPPAPKMSAIPQSELAAARAKLTPAQAALIDWRIAQVSPLTHQRVYDDYVRQGSNPYAGNAGAQAQEQLDRARYAPGEAPWEDKDWQAKQQAKEDAERARADKQMADYLNTPEAERTVVGGGGSSTRTSGYGNYLGTPMYTAPTATGGIMDWYNANVGRTDDRAKSDLTNFLKNSGYNANQLATALPQWSERDLELAGAPAAAPAVASTPTPSAAQPDMSRVITESADAPFRPPLITESADAPSPVAPPALVATAPAAPEPTYTAPNPLDPYDSYYFTGAAKGGLLRDGFVVPADVVSHFGNGSSEAGLKLLASKIGATPIKGDGDGMSDSIKTNIDGVQEARVANDEAYVSPEKVKELGNGSPEKGARKLYAMMDQIRKARTGTTKQGKEIDPNKFMPGGSVQRYAPGGTTTVPTGATGSESSLSNWAGDYVTNMLGQGAALANKPYEAYTGPLTAGASQLQNQAFTQAGNMQTPASIGQAATTAGGIASLAPGAGQYTSVGTDFGTTQAQQYMNPYLQSALNPAMEEARRQADISRMADAGRLTQAGAYGGSRQAIMESEGRRNLMDKQNQMLTSGYSTAFDKAQQQFNADQARRINEQQFATTSGLQGLQTGLQGAQTQGQLGSLQSQADLAGLSAMSGLGGVQRGIESEGIAADKAQFEEARLNPYKMVQFQQSLLSGLPLSAQSYSMPGTSNLTQFSQGATTVQQLLDILSGKTAAAPKQ